MSSRARNASEYGISTCVASFRILSLSQDRSKVLADQLADLNRDKLLFFGRHTRVDTFVGMGRYCGLPPDSNVAVALSCWAWPTSDHILCDVATAIDKSWVQRHGGQDIRHRPCDFMPDAVSRGFHSLST